MNNFVDKNIRDVDPFGQAQSTCLMANVRDNNFVLDFAPKSVLGDYHKNVIVFTAGWAFKMIPLIGEILAELAIDGETKSDIELFRIDRPGILKNLESQGNSISATAQIP
jgi:glycine/D-amino acid oxidase-like deaminating enzyme